MGAKSARRSRSNRGSGWTDLAHAGGNGGQRFDHGRGVQREERRARAVCVDVVCVPRRTGARDQSGTCVARYGKVLERLGKTLPARRPMGGSGGAFTYYTKR